MIALSIVGGAAGLAIVVTALVVALARRGRRADAVFLVVRATVERSTALPASAQGTPPPIV